MKSDKKDILSATELRQMPFQTPEGYFESFKKSAMENVGASSKPAGYKRVSAFLAAASVAAIIGAGAVLMTRDENMVMTEEDYIVFSDEMTNALYAETYQIAQSDEITDEDIIEYLIYSGVEVEELYEE